MHDFGLFVELLKQVGVAAGLVLTGGGGAFLLFRKKWHQGTAERSMLEAQTERIARLEARNSELQRELVETVRVNGELKGQLKLLNKLIESDFVSEAVHKFAETRPAPLGKK